MNQGAWDVSDSPASGFADLGSAASWVINGINFVSANGIMQGTGNFLDSGTYNVHVIVEGA